MARFKTVRRAISQLPSGRPFLFAGNIRCRVESQSCDNRKGVPVPGVNRDPLSAASLPKRPKFSRTERRLDQTCASQSERDRAGTIVGVIGKRFVSAAVAVGLVM